MQHERPLLIGLPCPTGAGEGLRALLMVWGVVERSPGPTNPPLPRRRAAMCPCTGIRAVQTALAW
jgi:hypothetical protein